MQRILQGSLRHFPAAELLGLLGREGHSGTLDVAAKDKRTRMVFRAGKVAWAESTDPALEIESVLAKRGLLTPEQRGAINADDLAASVASGAVTAAALEAFVATVVLDLFGWLGGAFEMVETMALRGEVAVDLDPLRLANEGRERTEAVKKLQEQYPDERAAVRPVDYASSKSEVSLRNDQLKVLMRVGRGRSLEDLCIDIGWPPLEVYTLVHELEKAGLVEVDQIVEPVVALAPLVGGSPGGKEQTLETILANRVPAAEATPVSAATAIGSLTGDDGRVHPLLDDEYTIGRDRTASIAIPDGSVSSRHARITRTALGFQIEDLQSRNGTYVNGDRVTERRLLANDDLVRVGKVILTFNLAADDGAAP